MLLNAEEVYKYYNGEAVLKNINFTVEDRDRIGLIGINGCGKSTLLKIIMGEETLDKTPTGKSSVSITNNKTIGFLAQNSGLDSDDTIKSEMKKPFAKLIEVNLRMQELEKSMVSASGDELEKMSAEYAEISAFYEANDGYNINVKINMVLNGMGFENVPTDRVINTLSGGEKTRLAMAKLLLSQPDLLILDEPTNHLDMQTLLWLEDYLSGYKGAILIVSHDRYFLDKICNRIFEIEHGYLTTYKGGYSSFVVQKKMNTERREKEFELQQKEIAKLEDYIARNKVRASTAKMAKSRQAALDKIERIEKPIEMSNAPAIIMDYDVVPPKELLEVSECELAVGEAEKRKLLCENVTFSIRRGEKVAFVGPNGAGKTSILKLIQSIIPHDNGRIKWNSNIRIAYFEQEHHELNPHMTVFEEVQNRYPRMSELMIRKTLASVMLTGEDVFKQTGVLSGGERAKLCFALMMLRRGNVLILDEPTNHLDLATKEILEDALVKYDGTIIFVSHDRYLLNKVAGRIIEVNDGVITNYNGSFDFYLEQKKADENLKLTESLQKKAEKESAAKQEQAVKAYRTKEQRAADAKKRQRISELEKLIETNEAQINTLENEISSPEISTDFEAVHRKCQELEKLRDETDKLFEEWGNLN